MNDTDRTAWLASRRRGIGGSDAPAVLGLSKWRTPLDVYLDKRGEAPPVVESPAMFWGTQLEPVIRAAYAEQTGQVVRVPAGILVHPTHEWMIGSIDGVTDDKRLVEIKTARTAEGWGEPGTDEIPEAYLIQVQHYLAVTALSRADVATLIGGQDFRIYSVEADAELQAMLIDREAEFWQNVQAGVPPDPVSLADVRQRFRLSVAREVQASAEVVQDVNYLAALRTQMAAFEGEADTVQARICKALAEADTLVGPDGRVLATWKTSKPTNRFDTSAFKAAHADLYQQFMKPGESSRRFLLKANGS